MQVPEHRTEPTDNCLMTAMNQTLRPGLIATCLECESEWIATAGNDTCFICGQVGVPGRASEYCGHGVRQGRLRCEDCAAA